MNEIIGSSSISLISQAYGQKDYEQTKIAIEQTISFKFLMASIAAVLIAVLLKPLMLLFSEADVVQHGLDYGYIRLFLTHNVFFLLDKHCFSMYRRLKNTYEYYDFS